MKFLVLFQRIARWMAMVLAVVAAGSCMAKIQFDVFPGHDGVARTSGWYSAVSIGATSIAMDGKTGARRVMHISR